MSGLINLDVEIFFKHAKEHERIGAMNEIEFVESLKIVEIKPEDLIVVKVKVLLTAQMSVLIKDHIKRIVPEARVIILDGDTDMGIIRGA